MFGINLLLNCYDFKSRHEVKDVKDKYTTQFVSKTINGPQNHIASKKVQMNFCGIFNLFSLNIIGSKKTKKYKVKVLILRTNSLIL